jgi:RsiW-degrading membrane proteinase PrsW (M82 family)
VGDEPALASTAARLPRYADRYRALRASTAPPRRWLAAAVLVVAAGPAGVLGAVVASLAVDVSLAFAVFAVVLVAPITEEYVKVAGPLYLAESRPWLVPAGWVLLAIAVAGGLGFAAIENWLYLTVYIEDPTELIIRWRWIFGPSIHGTASFLAGWGVRRMWLATDRHGTPPEVAIARPWFVGAVALHGSYNLLAVLLELTDTV